MVAAASENKAIIPIEVMTVVAIEDDPRRSWAS